MPVDWAIDAERHLFRVTYRTPVTMDEWRETVDEMRRVSRTGMHWLIDRRGAEPPTPEFARAVASYLAAHGSVLKGRAALLVDKVGDGAFGMARMQSFLNDDSAIVTRVFTSESEALAWLAPAPPFTVHSDH